MLLLVTRLSSQKIKVHLLMAESVQWHLKSRFNSGDAKLKKQPILAALQVRVIISLKK